ncbi:hypothetical protein Tco_0413264 [Tanacetum coccineum]
MEMEPGIENMTLNKYLEYEAEKERLLWDNVRSRRSPTNYDEAVADSFHQNKKDVIQPLIPTTLHTTPPNEDYVAPATKPILEKLLEINHLNVAMVDEEADPTRDLEEPERLLVEYPHFMEIHVHSVITKLEPFIHTQPLSPLYRIFESYKSSTKLYKVDREMKFPSRYGLKSSFPYPVANEHLNDVYCYFHPHLIPSEWMDTLLVIKGGVKLETRTKTSTSWEAPHAYPCSSNKEVKIETGMTRNYVVTLLLMMHMERSWLIIGLQEHISNWIVGNTMQLIDDGIFVIVDFARRSKLEAWLRACLLEGKQKSSWGGGKMQVFGKKRKNWTLN